MKYNKSLMGCCLLFILASNQGLSQITPVGLIQSSITLNSNLKTKTVLVTNLPDYGIGDSSEFLIAASWLKNGSRLECRSLLKFDYSLLPEFILKNPSMIHSAELILYPVNTMLTKDDLSKPVKIIVKRIIENWEDASTVWINQPSTDSSTMTVKLIKTRQKNNIANIDVTKLVSDMLRSGNNGFLIGPEYNAEHAVAMKMYASPKYENANLHPQLVINYMEPVSASKMMESVEANSRNTRVQSYQGGSSIQPTIRVVGGSSGN